MDWIESEYLRLMRQGCLDNDKNLNYYNEIVVINGDKILKRHELKAKFVTSDFIIEQSDKSLLGIGKDFLKDYNKTDVWS